MKNNSERKRNLYSIYPTNVEPKLTNWNVKQIELVRTSYQGASKKVSRKEKKKKKRKKEKKKEMKIKESV